MSRTCRVAAPLFVFVLLTWWPLGAGDFKPETIIALERSALDRWCKGDPQGFLETYARDISYFSPAEEHRVAAGTVSGPSSREDLEVRHICMFSPSGVLKLSLVSPDEFISNNDRPD